MLRPPYTGFTVVISSWIFANSNGLWPEEHTKQILSATAVCLHSWAKGRRLCAFLVVIFCLILLYLSGLKASGDGHRSGSECNTVTGTATRVSLGIVTPFTTTVCLHILSRRGAGGHTRMDSQMTISRYSRFMSLS